MLFDVITDYIAEARILLQDIDPPYRYLDSDLVLAFNIAVLESRRLRPDMWLGVNVLPAFYALVTNAATDTSSNVLNSGYVASQIAQGMVGYDTTAMNLTAINGAVNPIGSTNAVAAITSTTVVLNSNVIATVNEDDTVVFGAAGPIPIDQQYRMAFVYYICGNTQMRDEEETQDTRAAAFMQQFKGILVGAL